MGKIMPPAVYRHKAAPNFRKMCLWKWMEKVPFFFSFVDFLNIQLKCAPQDGNLFCVACDKHRDDYRPTFITAWSQTQFRLMK